MIEAQDGDGATPLMLAANNGRTEVVCELLQLASNVSARDQSGRTALMHAVEAVISLHHHCTITVRYHHCVAFDGANV